MDLALCFSGGKDSALAALLADPFFDVTLVTASFGLTDAATHAREAANALGFDHETVSLDRAIAEEAVERMVDDGYPRDGIQYVHEATLEAVAKTGVDAIGDGTRRDDRAPTIPRAIAQSLEDRHDVEYIVPLAGYGRSAIDTLAAERLAIERGPSESLAKGDYEHELRTLLANEHGESAVEEIFPDHTQSVVRGRQA
jgi:predicted subunit of tRNA(5-methylaminomethyl-2-thiouridylate) methyltransferase